jgi:hypothetical protein
VPDHDGYSSARGILESIGAIVESNGFLKFDPAFLDEVREEELELSDIYGTPVEQFTGAALVVVMGRAPNLDPAMVESVANYLAAMWLLSVTQSAQERLR